MELNLFEMEFYERLMIQQVRHNILYQVSTPANYRKITRSPILYMAANAALPPNRKSPLQKVAQT
ncbi:hypothetical protein [Microcoleus sp. D3_18a_C4]|uniref:hypothetical protein n=1 Tax=unclassified Microcoleus TaxID=2642155 RepID=UPI002FD0E997